MKASIVICTHNREKYIEKSLASACHQKFPGDQFEIIVVDNASTDQTNRLVKQMVAANPKTNVRLIEEKELGLSFARNTGIRHSSGEVILFLDDDAIADEDWLEKTMRVFDDQPNAAVVGGKIDPIWVEPLPAWLTKPAWAYFSVLDWGDGTNELLPSQYLAGANIAYRRRVLETVGGFSGKLGRKGASLLSCEESLLNRQISDRGFQILYSGASRVRHHVLPDRMNAEWILRRCYWQGISDAILNSILDPQGLFRTLLNPRFYARLTKGVVKLAQAHLIRTRIRRGELSLLESGMKAYYEAGIRLGPLYLPRV